MSCRAMTDPRALIWEFLAAHCAEQLVDESKLLSELELDSLQLLECLFELEQRCGRTLTNRELAALTTVADLIEVFTSQPTQSEKMVDEQ